MIAGGIRLGIPADQAVATFIDSVGTEPGLVPDGVVTTAYRICGACAAKADTGFPAPGLLGDNVPCIAQP